MRKYRLLILSVIVFGFLSFPVTAKPESSDQAQQEQAHKKSDDSRTVSTDPLPREYFTDMTFPERDAFSPPRADKHTLENGVSLYLLEDRELPLISLKLVLRTGSFHDPDDHVGLAEITGNVLRTGGTENRTPEEVNRFLENRAANIEVSVGDQKTTIYVSSLKKDFADVYEVFLDVLQNPAFEKEQIDVRKKKIRSRIKRRNDEPQQIGIRELNFQLFGRDSMYAREVEPWNLENINREDLVRFYENHFHAGNFLVGVLGDFDLDAMTSRLNKTLGGMETASPSELTFSEVDMEPEKRVAFGHKSDLSKSIIVMGHPVDVPRTHPDYGALAVASEILGFGAFSSRMFNRVRREEGLAYATTGGYRANYRYPGSFFVYAGTKSHTTVEAIDVSLDTVKSMRKEKVSKEELQQAKDNILNAFVFQFDEREEILSRQMRYDFFDMPVDWIETYQKQIRETTRKDVLRVSRKYIKPDHLVITVIGNEEEIEGDLSQFGPVENIDISLPEPPETGEKKTGDAKKGKEILQQWKTQLPEDMFTSMKGIRTEGEMIRQRGKRKIEGTFSSVQTMDGRIFRKMTMRGRNIVMTMGEEEAWMKGPRGNVQTLPSSAKTDMKSAKDFHYFTGLLHGIFRGTFEGTLLERKGEEGNQAVLRLTSEPGNEAEVTVNTNNWQIQEIVRSTNTGEKTIRYQQYQTREGIPFPETIIQTGPSGNRTTINMKKVEFLQSIDEKTFQRPDQKQQKKKENTGGK